MDLTLDNWIMSSPKEDRLFIAKTTLEIWDLFLDLEQKKFLRTTLKSDERKDFPEVLRTSDGLFDAFNMLFNIPTPHGAFVSGRNREFVEHNGKYGFTETRYIFLLLSESMSVFLRNVELFRACFLNILVTEKRKKGSKYPFWHNMGIGDLLNRLVGVCGSKASSISAKIDCTLRNALTHNLVWQKGFYIHYAKDITFTSKKRGVIRLDDLWKKASYQSKVTQCLIKTLVEWYA
jgi:hypothetical protein